MAKLQKVAEDGWVFQALADVLRALLRAVEIRDELLQVITANLDLYRQHQTEKRKTDRQDTSKGLVYGE